METNRYIRIDGVEYLALSINGKLKDSTWDNRDSKYITLEMDYNTLIKIFRNNMKWSIVQYCKYVVPEVDENNELVYDENNNVVTKQETEYVEEFDNSEYSLLGDITIHPDNTITVKMGKPTELESAYMLMLGGE